MQIAPPVGVIEEAGQSIVAALDDVLRYVGKIESGQACHTASFAVGWRPASAADADFRVGDLLGVPSANPLKVNLTPFPWCDTVRVPMAATSTSYAKPVLRIGCAGWSLPASSTHLRAAQSQLQRYADQFDAVEINSSFYRPHLPATYARWAQSVPDDFRFSVKLPRTISHQSRLKDCTAELEAFLAGVTELGEKLGTLLLQLPPTLAFDAAVVGEFFTDLRKRHAGAMACEPRHASWFTLEAGRLLRVFSIARVGADPARVPRAAVPGGDHRIEYLRLHGSPRMYYDAYGDAALQRVARRLSRKTMVTSERWCMFDNTARGAAQLNAVRLQRLLGLGR